MPISGPHSNGKILVELKIQVSYFLIGLTQHCCLKTVPFHVVVYSDPEVAEVIEVFFTGRRGSPRCLEDGSTTVGEDVAGIAQFG